MVEIQPMGFYRMVGIPRRTVLITGGLGFLGTNMAESLLADGHRVICLDNMSRPGIGNLRNLAYLQNLPMVVADSGVFRCLNIDVSADSLMADLRRGGLLSLSPPISHILHFAAQSSVDYSLTAPVEDAMVNIIGTLRLLEWVRSMSVPPLVIQTLSNKVYGIMPSVLEGSGYDFPMGISMRDKGIPEHVGAWYEVEEPYGVSKKAAGIYGEVYTKRFGVPVISLRCSGMYGPHQYGAASQGWLGWFIQAALQGLPITINGDGKQVRDMLYAYDAVAAIKRMMERPDLAGQAFNLGGGPAYRISLLQALDFIEQYGGKKIRVSYGPWRSGDNKVYYSDITRISKELRWKPKVPVVEGIKLTVMWARETFLSEAIKE